MKAGIFSILLTFLPVVAYSQTAAEMESKIRNKELSGQEILAYIKRFMNHCPALVIKSGLQLQQETDEALAAKVGHHSDVLKVLQTYLQKNADGASDRGQVDVELQAGLRHARVSYEVILHGATRSFSQDGKMQSVLHIWEFAPREQTPQQGYVLNLHFQERGVDRYALVQAGLEARMTPPARGIFPVQDYLKELEALKVEED
ncbi:hypothetical protein V8J88_01835 [Massilia sp. W12]|uniref:hypothetical protein n=1 Tax=Massilia sp. W12 TaxID=3126507 RepID=UPI0030D1FF7B